MRPRELLRNAARGGTDIVKIFNSMEAWIASEKVVAVQAAVRMIEFMTTKFLITRCESRGTVAPFCVHLPLQLFRRH
jgi:hypothetical protein